MTRDPRRTWLVVILLIGGGLAITLIVLAALVGLNAETIITGLAR